jgi:hypothetical protein
VKNIIKELALWILGITTLVLVALAVSCSTVKPQESDNWSIIEEGNNKVCLEGNRRLKEKDEFCRCYSETIIFELKNIFVNAEGVAVMNPVSAQQLVEYAVQKCSVDVGRKGI